jgi:hypothetical protein
MLIREVVPSLGKHEWNEKMVRFFVAALALALMACACETTAPRGDASKKADGPIEVTVGGKLEIRGQYQGAN